MADDLYQQVRDAGTPRTTKAEVVEYYQGAYPGKGKGGWKQAIVHDLWLITGIKPKNLERRFDPSRLNNKPKTKREKAEYVELGREIPTIPPAGGYHIEGTVWVQFSEGECETRELYGDFTTITGDDAQKLANASSAEDVAQMIVNYYMDVDIDTEHPPTDVSKCDSPDLIVTTIEE